MTHTPFQPFLVLVTARQRVAPSARTVRDELRALVGFIAEGAAAGVPLVQIREGDLEVGTLLTLAREAVSAVQGTSCRVVVNDRVDVAIASGAHGVHLKSAGPPAARVRQMSDQGWTVGQSAHTAAELVHGRGADYLVFGTVFETASKPDVAEQGVERLTDAVRQASAPLVAIGGITSGRLGVCARAGAAGVAGISWLLPPALGGVGPAEAVRAARAAFVAH